MVSGPLVSVGVDFEHVLGVSLSILVWVFGSVFFPHFGEGLELVLVFVGVSPGLILVSGASLGLVLLSFGGRLGLVLVC